MDHGLEPAPGTSLVFDTASIAAALKTLRVRWYEGHMSTARDTLDQTLGKHPKKSESNFACRFYYRLVASDIR